MLRLHAIQAKFGDSFILEYGAKTSPKYILIDGGPKGVYDDSLKSEIEKIVRTRNLDLVILSHVDDDHVVGLVEFFADIEAQMVNDDPNKITVGGLWHNSFSDTIDTTGDMESQIKTMLANSSLASTMSTTNNLILGVEGGRKLSILAKKIGIKINKEFGGKNIIADNIAGPITFDGLKITVVGPTNSNLINLREKWIEWIRTHPKKIASDPLVAAKADRSVPNLSSIMILVESDGKTILLTGDGRGDHLLQGLGRARLLDNSGKIHVDVLKVQHHGSDRNSDEKFFDNVTASQYVISAMDYKNQNNPDLSTLQWIADSAKTRKTKITIHVTNKTKHVPSFITDYPEKHYDDHVVLNIMKNRAKSLSINLA
jgi:metal-dependent hydrolase (beta-lactamase superfamily II)